MMRDDIDAIPSIWRFPVDSPVGHILEFDLEYPDTLRDLHKDLLVCSKHRSPQIEIIQN